MLAPLMAGAVLAAAPTLPAVAGLPACLAVAVSFDRAGGSSDGMSQPEVLLIVRNAGSAACTIPGLPKLRFDDEAGHALAALREPPPGMHPGPVVTPIVLAPGAAASAALHWVGAEATAGRACVFPSRMVIGEGPDAPTAPWRFGPLCGQSGKPIPFRQPVLRPIGCRHLECDGADRSASPSNAPERRRDVATRRN